MSLVSNFIEQSKETLIELSEVNPVLTEAAFQVLAACAAVESETKQEITENQQNKLDELVNLLSGAIQNPGYIAKEKQAELTERVVGVPESLIAYEKGEEPPAEPVQQEAEVEGGFDLEGLFGEEEGEEVIDLEEIFGEDGDIDLDIDLEDTEGNIEPEDLDDLLDSI